MDIDKKRLKLFLIDTEYKKSPEDTRKDTNVVLTELRTALKNKRRIFRMKAHSRIYKQREEHKELDFNDAKNFFSHCINSKTSARFYQYRVRFRI